MKKNKPSKNDDLRAEYDFTAMRSGVRGKYAERLRKGSNVVLLEPDVAAAFPNAIAVNDALRAVMEASRAMRRRTARPNRPLQRPALARRR
ncbi:MAG TPA: hypothetical protein VFD92_14460 [Candidatus Binatia bacterium]|nr:hypothetical protein [Candidatus Binatia bacterium]